MFIFSVFSLRRHYPDQVDEENSWAVFFKGYILSLNGTPLELYTKLMN